MHKKTAKCDVYSNQAYKRYSEFHSFLNFQNRDLRLKFLVLFEFKSEAGKKSRQSKFENILSVTTIVGVNLFVSLLSDSNRIKQQPLILISLE